MNGSTLNILALPFLTRIRALADVVLDITRSELSKTGIDVAFAIGSLSAISSLIGFREGKKWGSP
jgi:hypothetical protein